MPALLFVLYVVAEVSVLLLVGQAIGAVWTVLLLIAGSAIGLMLVGSQWRRVVEGLQRAAAGQRSPDGAIADGVLVAIGSVLMFVPGLVTSVLGLLLLVPPTRFLLRPAVVFIASRRFDKAVAAAREKSGVIDGEVVGQWYGDRPGSAQVAIQQGPHVIVDTDPGWGTATR